MPAHASADTASANALLASLQALVGEQRAAAPDEQDALLAFPSLIVDELDVVSRDDQAGAAQLDPLLLICDVAMQQFCRTDRFENRRMREFLPLGEGLRRKVFATGSGEFQRGRGEVTSLPAVLEDISEDGRYGKEDRWVEFGEDLRDGFRRRPLGQ